MLSIHISCYVRSFFFFLWLSLHAFSLLNQKTVLTGSSEYLQKLSDGEGHSSIITSHLGTTHKICIVLIIVDRMDTKKNYKLHTTDGSMSIDKQHHVYTISLHIWLVHHYNIIRTLALCEGKNDRPCQQCHNCFEYVHVMILTKHTRMCILQRTPLTSSIIIISHTILCSERIIMIRIRSISLSLFLLSVEINLSLT